MLRRFFFWFRLCSKPNHFSLFEQNVILTSVLGTWQMKVYIIQAHMPETGTKSIGPSVVIWISIHLMNAIVTSIATSLASIGIKLNYIEHIYHRSHLSCFMAKPENE